MASNLERYKSDLDKLISLGQRMVLDLHLRALKQKGKLNKKQQEALNKIEGEYNRDRHPFS